MPPPLTPLDDEIKKARDALGWSSAIPVMPSSQKKEWGSLNETERFSWATNLARTGWDTASQLEQQQARAVLSEFLVDPEDFIGTYEGKRPLAQTEVDTLFKEYHAEIPNWSKEGQRIAKEDVTRVETALRSGAQPPDIHSLKTPSLMGDAFDNGVRGIDEQTAIMDFYTQREGEMSRVERSQYKAMFRESKRRYGSVFNVAKRFVALEGGVKGLEIRPFVEQLSPDKYLMFKRFVHELAPTAIGKPENRGVWDKLGLAFTRGMKDSAANVDTFLKGAFASEYAVAKAVRWHEANRIREGGDLVESDMKGIGGLLANGAYDAARMAPNLLAGIGLLATGGPVAGTAWWWAQSTGSAYEEYLAQGIDREHAWPLAVAVGAIEAVIENVQAQQLLVPPGFKALIITTLKENVEEAGQDFTRWVGKGIGVAVSDTAREMNWSEEYASFMENRVRTAFALMPLMAGGQLARLAAGPHMAEQIRTGQPMFRSLTSEMTNPEEIPEDAKPVNLQVTPSRTGRLPGYSGNPGLLQGIARAKGYKEVAFGKPSEATERLRTELNAEWKGTPLEKVIANTVIIAGRKTKTDLNSTHGKFRNVKGEWEVHPVPVVTISPSQVKQQRAEVVAHDVGGHIVWGYRQLANPQSTQAFSAIADGVLKRQGLLSVEAATAKQAASVQDAANMLQDASKQDMPVEELFAMIATQHLTNPKHLQAMVEAVDVDQFTNLVAEAVELIESEFRIDNVYPLADTIMRADAPGRAAPGRRAEIKNIVNAEQELRQAQDQAPAAETALQEADSALNQNPQDEELRRKQAQAHDALTTTAGEIEQLQKQIPKEADERVASMIADIERAVGHRMFGPGGEIETTAGEGTPYAVSGASRRVGGTVLINPDELASYTNPQQAAEFLRRIPHTPQSVLSHMGLGRIMSQGNIEGVAVGEDLRLYEADSGRKILVLPERELNNVPNRRAYWSTMAGRLSKLMGAGDWITRPSRELFVGTMGLDFQTSAGLDATMRYPVKLDFLPTATFKQTPPSKIMDILDDLGLVREAGNTYHHYKSGNTDVFLLEEGKTDERSELLAGWLKVKEATELPAALAGEGRTVLAHQMPNNFAAMLRTEDAVAIAKGGMADLTGVVFSKDGARARLVSPVGTIGYVTTKAHQLASPLAGYNAAEAFESTASGAIQDELQSALVAEVDPLPGIKDILNKMNRAFGVSSPTDAQLRASMSRSLTRAADNLGKTEYESIADTFVPGPWVGELFKPTRGGNWIATFDKKDRVTMWLLDADRKLYARKSKSNTQGEAVQDNLATAEPGETVEILKRGKTNMCYVTSKSRVAACDHKRVTEAVDLARQSMGQGALSFGTTAEGNVMVYIDRQPAAIVRSSFAQAPLYRHALQQMAQNLPRFEDSHRAPRNMAYQAMQDQKIAGSIADMTKLQDGAQLTNEQYDNVVQILMDRIDPAERAEYLEALDQGIGGERGLSERRTVPVPKVFEPYLRQLGLPVQQGVAQATVPEWWDFHRKAWHWLDSERDNMQLRALMDWMENPLTGWMIEQGIKPDYEGRADTIAYAKQMGTGKPGFSKSYLDTYTSGDYDLVPINDKNVPVDGDKLLLEDSQPGEEPRLRMIGLPSEEEAQRAGGYVVRHLQSLRQRAKWSTADINKQMRSRFNPNFDFHAMTDSDVVDLAKVLANEVDINWADVNFGKDVSVFRRKFGTTVGDAVAEANRAESEQRGQIQILTKRLLKVRRAMPALQKRQLQAYMSWGKLEWWGQTELTEPQREAIAIVQQLGSMHLSNMSFLDPADENLQSYFTDIVQNTDLRKEIEGAKQVQRVGPETLALKGEQEIEDIAAVQEARASGDPEKIINAVIQHGPRGSHMRVYLPTIHSIYQGENMPGYAAWAWDLFVDNVLVRYLARADYKGLRRYMRTDPRRFAGQTRGDIPAETDFGYRAQLMLNHTGAMGRARTAQRLLKKMKAIGLWAPDKKAQYVPQVMRQWLDMKVHPVRAMSNPLWREVAEKGWDRGLFRNPYNLLARPFKQATQFMGIAQVAAILTKGLTSLLNLTQAGHTAIHYGIQLGDMTAMPEALGWLTKNVATRQGRARIGKMLLETVGSEKMLQTMANEQVVDSYAKTILGRGVPGLATLPFMVSEGWNKTLDVRTGQIYWGRPKLRAEVTRRAAEQGITYEQMVNALAAEGARTTQFTRGAITPDRPLWQTRFGPITQFQTFTVGRLSMLHMWARGTSLREANSHARLRGMLAIGAFVGMQAAAAGIVRRLFGVDPTFMFLNALDPLSASAWQEVGVERNLKDQVWRIMGPAPEALADIIYQYPQALAGAPGAKRKLLRGVSDFVTSLVPGMAAANAVARTETGVTVYKMMEDTLTAYFSASEEPVDLAALWQNWKLQGAHRAKLSLGDRIAGWIGARMIQDRELSEGRKEAAAIEETVRDWNWPALVKVRAATNLLREAATDPASLRLIDKWLGEAEALRGRMGDPKAKAWVTEQQWKALVQSRGPAFAVKWVNYGADTIFMRHNVAPEQVKRLYTYMKPIVARMKREGFFTPKEEDRWQWIERLVGK